MKIFDIANVRHSRGNGFPVIKHVITRGEKKNEKKTAFCRAFLVGRPKREWGFWRTLAFLVRENNGCCFNFPTRRSARFLISARRFLTRKAGFADWLTA